VCKGASRAQVTCLSCSCLSCKVLCVQPFLWPVVAGPCGRVKCNALSARDVKTIDPRGNGLPWFVGRSFASRPPICPLSGPWLLLRSTLASWVQVCWSKRNHVHPTLPCHLCACLARRRVCAAAKGRNVGDVCVCIAQIERKGDPIASTLSPVPYTTLVRACTRHYLTCYLTVYLRVPTKTPLHSPRS
jgi:hypothetical protein